MWNVRSVALNVRRDPAFALHVSVAVVVMLLAIWLSSGTMAPYAATTSEPRVSEHCGYLRNIDHPHFLAPLKMLEAAPPRQWSFSVVLRRLLYPIAAYPFVKLAGFESGGFLFNLLLHACALISFAVFVRRRIDRRAAIAGAWLLATYPGITYWAGLPYCYAIIVPASIWCFMALVVLEESTSLRQIALCCGAMGLLFTGYDLWPFFAPPALFMLVRRRLWAGVALGALLLALPTLLVTLALQRIWHVPSSSPNSAIYGNIVRSYVAFQDLAGWWHSVKEAPRILVANYFYSNFIFLPALFLVAITTGTKIRTCEAALLLMALALFLFNNLAPPYQGWQMRGYWIPRIYQPILGALLFYVCRAVTGARPARRMAIATLLTILANASVAFGPIGRVPWTGLVYQRFYRHADAGALDRNLSKYGRRPLGVCRQ